MCVPALGILHRCNLALSSRHLHLSSIPSPSHLSIHLSMSSILLSCLVHPSTHPSILFHLIFSSINFSLCLSVSLCLSHSLSISLITPPSHRPLSTISVPLTLISFRLPSHQFSTTPSESGRTVLPLLRIQSSCPCSMATLEGRPTHMPATIHMPPACMCPPVLTIITCCFTCCSHVPTFIHASQPSFMCCSHVIHTPWPLSFVPAFIHVSTTITYMSWAIVQASLPLVHMSGCVLALIHVSCTQCPHSCTSPHLAHVPGFINMYQPHQHPQPSSRSTTSMCPHPVQLLSILGPACCGTWTMSRL